MRLFIAIDFETLSGYFKDLQEQIPKDLAKFKLANTFHLTLKFLGEVEENKVEKIKELLKEIKLKSFNVDITNIGVFPNENYIKVIWVGLEDNIGVINLQQKIESSLQSLFKKEKRFHPHITLARVRFIKDKENFVDKLNEIKVEPKTFQVTNFKLIKSTLTSEGPVYEEISCFNSNNSSI